MDNQVMPVQVSEEHVLEEVKESGDHTEFAPQLPPEPEIDWDTLTKKNVKKKKVKLEAIFKEDEGHKEAGKFSEIMDYFSQKQVSVIKRGGHIGENEDFTRYSFFEKLS